MNKVLCESRIRTLQSVRHSLCVVGFILKIVKSLTRRLIAHSNTVVEVHHALKALRQVLQYNHHT